MLFNLKFISLYLFEMGPFFFIFVFYLPTVS